MPSIPKLSIIDKFTKPKARLDSIFTLKREIVRWCYRFIDVKINQPTLIEQLQQHISQDYIKGALNNHYYDLVHSKIYDAKLNELLRDRATDKTDDGFYMVEMGDDLTNLLNRWKARPKHLPTPLVYYETKIKSLYVHPFWCTFKKDVFGHETMVIRDGTENKYFSYMDNRTVPYPTYTQPFKICQGIDLPFQRYDITFLGVYEQMRGLFNMWYGFRW